MAELFGARYYDARTSVWQSADPVLDEYLDGEPNGGVFNPINLSLYTYSYQNPVKLSDPDGNKPEDTAKRIGKEALSDLKRGAMTAICMACVQASDSVEAGKFIASAVSDPVGTFNDLQVVKDVKALGSSDDAVRDDAIGGLAYGAAKIVGVIAAGFGIKGKGPQRSLDNPSSLVGASAKEIKKLIPKNWISSETNKPGGTRFLDPKNKGDAVRMMPGKATDPNPVKQGPYLRTSIGGKKSEPIPMKGNKSLNDD